MNVAFSAKAGPLATIGLQIITLDQAMQLATGAYGWYKARQRSQSLLQLLGAQSASLVTTSAFDWQAYVARRKYHGDVLGVVVQNGQVQSVAMPEASTARPEDPGSACLRALTTGLLCFYDSDATASILSQVLPGTLVQTNQDDATLDFSGPLLSGLRDYVKAIATEENSDKLRQYLQDIVSNHQARVGGIELCQLLNDDQLGVVEYPLIVGCLRWILSPAHKRNSTQYPTRSLQVWSIARVMQELGFSVASSSELITSEEIYKNATASDRLVFEHPEVFLVTANVGHTDSYQPGNEVNLEESLELRPQITPLRGAPWLFFRHLRGQLRRVNADFLADVWNYSFHQATLNVEPDYHLHGNMRLMRPQDQTSSHAFHRKLLDVYSPNLKLICGSAAMHFLPRKEPRSHDSVADMIRSCSQDLNNLERSNVPEDVRDLCYTLLAIVAGTSYGIVSKFCSDEGNPMTLDTIIAITPDFVFSNRFASLVSMLVSPLNKYVGYRDWLVIISELILGHRSTMLEAWTRDSETALAHEGLEDIRQNHRVPETPVLGVQANGLALVLDFAVTPSLRPESLFHVHLSRGQLVTLPVGLQGYVESSSRNQSGIEMLLAPEGQSTSLDLSTTAAAQCSESIVVDSEPCWEGDPRTVVFRFRLYGAQICPINIASTIRGYQTYVLCSCAQATHQLTIPDYDWHILTIDHLARRSYKGANNYRVDLREEAQSQSHVFIDASQSRQASLFAVGVVMCSDMFIVQDCAKCLERVLTNRWRRGRAVVIKIINEAPRRSFAAKKVPPTWVWG